MSAVVANGLYINIIYDKIKYTSAIQKDNVIGTQFHPEKSGEVGLNFLKDVIKYS